jgi:hypothetical protein
MESSAKDHDFCPIKKRFSLRVSIISLFLDDQFRLVGNSEKRTEAASGEGQRVARKKIIPRTQSQHGLTR